MNIILISGILGVIASIILLLQIKEVQDSDKNQALKKFCWLYWSIVTITAIHEIVSQVSINTWVTSLVITINPLLGFMNVINVFVFCLYLSSLKTNSHERQNSHK